MSITLPIPMFSLDMEFTATNTDIFSASDIAQPSRNLTLLVWAASTVNTATLETPQQDHNPGKTQLLRKRTDGIPSLADDDPYIVFAEKGKHPILVLGGTTGTVHVTVLAYPR